MMASLPAAALAAELAAAPVSALSAVLDDVVHEYLSNGRPQLRWQTFWVLNWATVEGATHYEVRLKTSEGTSRKAKTVEKPPFRLEVANGDNAKTQGLLARQVQLDTIGSLLSVQVMARLANGETTAASPWLQVGLALPLKP